MSLLYSLKESLAGMQKARLATSISITTIAFLLIITSVVVLFSFNINHLSEVLNAQVQIQAFLLETVSEDRLGELSARLLDMEPIEKVQFISKEEAAAEFKKEFGNEIFDILEENPLPASFLLKLTPEYRTEEKIRVLAKTLEEIPEIADVAYHGRALSLLHYYARISKWASLVIISLVALASLLIISNTIRLIILSRRYVIETMQLVGATVAFIRRPFYFEGLIQGLGGGMVALLLLYSVFFFVESNWPNIFIIPPQFWLMVILTGGLFGLLGAAIAIKKFL